VIFLTFIENEKATIFLKNSRFFSDYAFFTAFLAQEDKVLRQTRL